MRHREPLEQIHPVLAQDCAVQSSLANIHYQARKQTGGKRRFAPRRETAPQPPVSRSHAACV
ncbi:MAG: hypothetical protein ACRD5F_16530 [Candidatus Acidiferrales bacterium]